MLRRLTLSSAVSVAIATMLSAPVFAVEPQPIEAGRFNIIPTLGVEYSHTDNMYLDDSGERSSNLLEVIPRVEAYTQNEGGSNVIFRGQVFDGNYSISDVDDYTDWRFDVIGDIILNSRNSLVLSAYAYDGHNRRGTGFSQGGVLFAQPETWSDRSVGGSYQFGMDNSPNLLLTLNRYSREYDALNILSQFGDVDRDNVAVRFTWPVSPRTGVFVEYQDNSSDYQTDPLPAAGLVDTRDFDENFIYVGVSWEATALTSGSVKLGNGKQDMKDTDRVDPSGFSFDISIDWEPMTYSAVNFNAFRRFTETFAFGDSLQTTQFAVTWNHDWSDRISSLFEYSITDDEYKGISRNDDIDSISIGVNYALQRWMDVNLSIVNAERDSSFGASSNLFSWKETSIFAGLTISL